MYAYEYYLQSRQRVDILNRVLAGFAAGFMKLYTLYMRISQGLRGERRQDIGHCNERPVIL